MSAAFREAEGDDAKPVVRAQLDRLTAKAATRREQSDDCEDDQDSNEDDLFDELERELEEDDERGNGMMGRLREERMAALQAE